MITKHQIIDTALPEDQNFYWLKAKGLQYIQTLAGTQWTNYNDSDPGVTILEQLCYALTELGYCINFPIEDILSNEQGDIPQDQFYLPEDILTCSPITLNDYRKLILDNEALIKNIYIDIEPSGCYQVYLFVKQSNAELLSAIQVRTNTLLNQHRNIGEFFYFPKILELKPIKVNGQLRLADNISHDDILANIQLTLDNYISPPIRKLGYDDMKALGLNSDDIFNGTKLTKGWIPDEDLTNKRTEIKLSDIARWIMSVQGVKEIMELSFEQDNTEIASHEIADIILSLSIANKEAKGLTITQQHSLELFKLRQTHKTEKVTATVNITPQLPQGRFRQIEDYYSVQNTFPLIYAIGAESLPIDTPNYRVAQSRQLKGYLMVFDQLLANQFSQLANISTLFSFKHAETIAPKQGKPYDNLPYQLFPPTYFCQPLYHIPDVKPLLRGTENYLADASVKQAALAEELSWQEFQKDPFNQYILGLRQNMETDNKRDDRRNRVLDHLLARHGEPSAFYDELISTARWYGSTLKTRIIIKSILLQNLGVISYQRTKARDLIQAQLLGTAGRYRLSKNSFNKLADFNINPEVLAPFVNLSFESENQLRSYIYQHSELNTLQQDWDNESINRFKKQCLQIEDCNAVKPPQDYQLICNGQLNLNKLSALEKLNDTDFKQYSTIELQINLLLGLRQHYQLLIELLSSLVNSELFQDWLEKGGVSDFNLPNSDITVTVKRTDTEDAIYFSEHCLLKIKNASDMSAYQAHLNQIRWFLEQSKGVILIENLLLLKPNGINIDDLGLTIQQFYLNTLLIFPSYINLFGAFSFEQRLSRLVEVYFPAHIKNTLIPASHELLNKVIPEFVTWHNGLKELNMNDITRASALKLAKLLLVQEAI